MASRDIAREAIKRLKLVGNPEFDATASEIGPVRQLMMLLGIGRTRSTGPPRTV